MNVFVLILTLQVGGLGVPAEVELLPASTTASQCQLIAENAQADHAPDAAKYYKKKLDITNLSVTFDCRRLGLNLLPKEEM